jgi:uncharacterized protein YcbK (DUF882 family)
VKLSKYFTSEECKCKGDSCCGGVYPLALEFLSVMDALRRLSGGPIHVTSGFRCYTHNSRISKATQSYHTKGLALDIYSSVMSVGDLVKLAESLGLNVIPHETFIHVDGRHLV